MKNLVRRRWVLAVLLLAGLASPPHFPARADQTVLDLVPEDTAIVEVDAPTGSKITVNGRDYGTQRRFEYRPLKRESTYTYEVRSTQPDGKTASRTVLAGGGQRIQVHLAGDRADQPEIYLRTGHKGQPSKAEFSPDGRWLATGGGDGKIVIWDVASGKPIRDLMGHDAGLGSLQAPAFAGDGQFLVCGASEGRSVLWDVTTGRLLRTLQRHQTGSYASSVDKVAVSPDGRTVLAEGDGNTAVLYDLSRAEVIRTLNGHTKWLWSLAFSPDGQRALTGSHDGTAILWDLASGRALTTFRGHDGGVWAAFYGKDARTIMTLANSQLRVWNTSGTQLKAVKTPKGIRACALAPDGRSLWTNGGWADNQLIQWDADTLKPLVRLDAPRTGHILAISPDGRTAFDGLNLWDLESKQPIRSLSSRLADLDEPQILAGGQSLLFASGRRLDVWDLEKSQVRHVLDLPKGYRYVGKLSLSSDGRTLAAVSTPSVSGPASSTGPRILVWDVATHQLRREVTISPHHSLLFEVSPDGRYAVTEDDAGVGAVAPAESQNKSFFLRIWDLERGVLFQTIVRKARNSILVRFHDDGRRMLLVRHDWIGFVDIRTGQELQVLWTPKSLAQFQANIRVRGTMRDLSAWLNCALTPDGSFLVCRGNELTWKVNWSTRKPEIVGSSLLLEAYDARTGTRLRTFSTPVAAQIFNLGMIRVSPDRRTLLTSDQDGRMTHWDLNTGRSIREYPHFLTGWDRDCTFLSDSRRVLFKDAGGLYRLLDLATGEIALRLVAVGNEEEEGADFRPGWLAITPDGLFDGSEEARQSVGFRIGGGLNVVPLDRFFQDFYRAGLTQEVLGGRRSAPEVRLAMSLPPRLKIIAPESGPAGTSTATVEVEANDQGGGIANLAITQNGARVLAPGDSRRDGPILRRTFRVDLIEGTNRLKITATSGDGSWESEPADVVLDYGRELPRSRLHLVAVGVSKYADANMNLNYAARDARALAALFRTRGGRLYEEVRIAEVVDEQGTRAGIREALRKAAGETRPQDTIVLFLAGHGTTIGQRYYFVPHELRRQAERLEDDIRDQGLAADVLSDDLGSAHALKRMLILDTCASGGALGLAVRGRSGFALRGAIERLSRAQGIFTIAAASAGEEAKEAKELGHGVLSYTLLAALNAAGGGPLEGQHVRPSGPDGVVDVLEWFSFAAGQVPRLTEKLYGAAQDVQTSGQGSSFPVLPIEER